MKILLPFLVFLVSGCAQMFPASAREISPNVYRLTATGNSFATFGSLKAKIDKKAAKVCGEQNYEFREPPKLSTGTSQTYNNGIVTSAGYIQVNSTVECEVN